MTALLRFYPAAYRREFGDEIADAYREATGGVGRAARLREAADVAGHAVRMRLGLGSAGRAGRGLAALAPFAAIGVGADAVCWSTLVLRVLDTPGGPGGTGAVMAAVVAVVAVRFAALLGAAVALAGAWAAGAWTALAAVVAGVAVDLVRLGPHALGFAAVFWALPVLLALAAVACPPDLRPQPRVRTATGVLAAVVWAAVLATALVVCPLPYPLGALRFAVPVAAGLLLTGRQAFAGLRTASAVLGVGVVLLTLGALSGAFRPTVLLPLVGLVLVAAVATGVRRRHRGRDPLAGG
ncbi:hypothetical protein [Streptomyces sp. NPDC093225]|uniref:hypothetical protein n=1 Tax=Streptomyces sp. NPDC093225 TaxID=3366034 RepID=UPI00382C93E1